MSRFKFLTPEDQAGCIDKLIEAGWPEAYAKEAARMLCCGLQRDDNLFVLFEAEKVLTPETALVTINIGKK